MASAAERGGGANSPLPCRARRPVGSVAAQEAQPPQQHQRLVEPIQRSDDVSGAHSPSGTPIMCSSSESATCAEGIEPQTVSS